MPVYLFVIPASPPMPEKTQLEKLKLIDWAGWIVSLGAMITIVMAINFAGVLFDWNSGSTIALFVVSGVLWIAFFLQQHSCFLTTRENRLLPIHLYTQKAPALLFLAASAVAGVAYVSVYYIPLYVQFTRGDSAIYTAVRLLPYICPLIVAMPSSGAFLSRWGWYKPVYIIGAILALATLILMGELIHISKGQLYIFILLIFT